MPYVTGFGKGTSPGGVWDIATIKYSPDGNILWLKRYAGPVNFSSYGYSIALDASNNVIVAGATSDGLTDGQFVTVKYDQNGNEMWARRYAGSGIGIDYGYCCAADISGNVY